MMQWMFDLIANLRGGTPDTCDFCGQEFTEANHPLPEEGGEWACSECVARWAKKERQGEPPN
jgi:hypothetical protein